MRRRYRLGGKDLHLDANSLRVLWKGDAGGGGNSPVWVPSLVGWNSTTSALVYPTASVSSPNGILMSTTENIRAYGWFATPAGYSGTITVSAIFRSTAGTGNIRLLNDILFTDYFTSLGPDATSGNTLVPAAGAAGAYKVLPISVALTAQAAVRLACLRSGSHTDDTYSQSLFFFGWEVVYG